MNVPLALQKLIVLRRPGEKDMSLGMRVAALIPVAMSPLAFAGMLLAHVGGEAGMLLTVMYWLFIGIWQWLYLAPAIGWALSTHRRDMAKGLALGGLIISIANATAWGIGMYLGVTQWPK